MSHSDKKGNLSKLSGFDWGSFVVKTAKLYFLQVQFSGQFCKSLQKTPF